MGRPVYPHEMCDPDFAWLVSNYREQNPDHVVVESTFLPIVLLSGGEPSENSKNLALPIPEDFLIDDLLDLDEL